MADFTADDATSFGWAVDNAIRSETASNLGASPAHSFASVVDYALRSSSASEADLHPSFGSRVDYVIRTSNGERTGGRAEGSSPEASNVTENVVKGFQLFSKAELVAATNNFSLDNKIGGGAVFIGKLLDGREVVIKRGQKASIKSKLAFLSRLHHENLVGLIGFCERRHEKLLVYEYMKNGSLYDHLHEKKNVEKGSSVLNDWKMRIKIALDAARGIQYLRNHAVPSIIHRNIISPNILIDATWTARVSVSDFELCLMSSEVDRDHPLGYGLDVLTGKSDVYGFGVVLLELLTGKRAIFKYGEDGGIFGTFMSVVDFAVPRILAGELVEILDPRVGPPDVDEVDAVELLAYLAIDCVNWKGKDRPTLSVILVHLERRVSYFESIL
ncbi:putative serine/threonine-protein kinase-like protein CCR3 [Vigna unguiculata]|uniref:putative serine/threonine-protein kinase-like protein CCR3 n=1 Tax=Vigna unguiculata TaxID=3917 RepID=UPI001016BBF8|nr:putative serine/threonine-protein kinase-like protein CCR3 [Vigna unguiculata]